MRFRTLSGTIPTPAAGQGFAAVFSQVQRVKLHSLMFTFTSDAVVGNRLVWAQLQDPTGVPVYETGSSVDIAASSTVDFVLSPVFGNVVAMQGKVNAAVGLGIPSLWLPPAWQVVAGVVGENPADQLSAISFAATYGEPKWDKEGDAEALDQFLATLAS